MEENLTEENPRILIVEDEPFIAENLQEMLGIFDYEDTEVANSASQAIKCIKASRPELVLLDVKIKGDQDGIELGQIIKEQFEIPFVYITSYSDKETIDRAKQTQPLGFIVKPFTKDDVYAAIEVALFNRHRNLAGPKKSPFPENNMNNFGNEAIFVKIDNKLVKMKYDDILYVHSQSNIMQVYTRKQGMFKLRSSLINILHQLPKDRFLRVQKSYIVHADAITAIDTSNIYIDEVAIPIGRAYYNAFSATLNTINAG